MRSSAVFSTLSSGPERRLLSVSSAALTQPLSLLYDRENSTTLSNASKRRLVGSMPRVIAVERGAGA
jgi:hypothetical protein